MSFFQLVRREMQGSLNRLAVMSGLGGVSNAAILAAINSGAQAAGNRRLRDHRGAGRGRDDPLFLRQPRTSDDAAGAGIVETILEGRQPPKMTLAALMWPLPCLWQEQVRAHLQGNTASELPFNPSGCRSIGTKAHRPQNANCLRAL